MRVVLQPRVRWARGPCAAREKAGTGRGRDDGRDRVTTAERSQRTVEDECAWPAGTRWPVRGVAGGGGARKNKIETRLVARRRGAGRRTSVGVAVAFLVGVQSRVSSRITASVRRTDRSSRRRPPSPPPRPAAVDDARPSACVLTPTTAADGVCGRCA